MDGEKIAYDHIRLEADGVGVGADKGAPKDARRPVRDIVPLQRFQQRQLYLRLLCDRSERDLLSFATLTESRAETLRQ